MDLKTIEKIGVVIAVLFACSTTIPCFIYFFREDPNAIPLAFLPVGSLGIYVWLARLDGKPVTMIPKSSLEFVLTNLGFLILYVAVLFAVTGYLFMKVAFLVLFLLIVGFTTWGYVVKNIRRK